MTRKELMILMSAETHNIDVAANGERCLREFESELIQKMGELHVLYAGNVQTIGGLCSPVPIEEPSVEDYLHWLSDEVSDLPSMFSGVNENFASYAIEGALAIAGDSVDLHAVQNAAGEGGTDILPTRPSVQSAAQAVSKKW
jgi:hypothetical protein